MNNYDKILRDKENNLTQENSDMDMNWAAMEVKLNSATQSTSKDATFNFKKIIKGLMVTAVACIIGFVIFTFTKNKKQLIPNTDLSVIISAVKPPMPAINVPYETFMYDAEIGDTLFTKNGSIIIFPKNAVLNDKGEIVTGKIEVRTREFNDPLDYYMAGIPMTYDSAGVKYTFVSSGMIDIKAYSNNELLFVNPNAKPQINLVSTNNDKNTNLYILDTATGQWINKGRDEVNDLAESSKQQNAINTTLIPEKPKKKDLIDTVEKSKLEKDTSSKPIITENPSRINTIALVKESPRKPKSVIIGKVVKEIKEYSSLSENKIVSLEEANKRKASSIEPIIPEKASGKNPTIEIIIDPASFKELLAYNNLKFEVLNSNIEIVGNDSKTEWDNVELIRTGDKGYIAKFSLGQKTVQYKVKPVLEGKDYENALKVYDNKIKEYYDAQKVRINNEQTEQNTIALNDKINDEENKKTEASNEIVIAKNKVVEAENKITEIENNRIGELNVLISARNKQVAEDKKLYQITMKKQQKTNDSLRLIWEKENRASILNGNLLRSFTIDGFGYWNCDAPTIPYGIPLSANFMDTENKKLKYVYLSTISVGINRIFTFSNTNISVIPNRNHMIWLVSNNNFYYLTYKDYEKLEINVNTKSQIFKLKKYTAELNSIEALREVLFNKT
jgi:hypothetical protein